MKSINKKITLALITLMIVSTIIFAPGQLVRGCTTSYVCIASLATDNLGTNQIAHYSLTINNTGSAKLSSANIAIPTNYSNLVSSSIIVTSSSSQSWTANVVAPPTQTTNGTILLQGPVEGIGTNQKVTTNFTITCPSTANVYQWIIKANLTTSQSGNDYQSYTIYLNQRIPASSTPTPSPTANPIPTQDPTPTPISTATPIPTPTVSPNPTSSFTPSPTPVPTSTPAISSTTNPAETKTQTAVTSKTSSIYTVTFQQQGLSSGKSWDVTFNGATKSATSTTIAFAGIKAGTYEWNASSIIGENENTRYEANDATSGSIKVTSATTQTITYDTQYYLTVDSKYGNPTGEGWYYANTTAQFAIKTTTTQGLGTQYAFSGWTGTGTGSYTGISQYPIITMVGPITETANWDPASSLYSVLLVAVVILIMMLLATFLALKRRKKKQKDDQ